MFEGLFSRFAVHLASEDVIDLYFVMSDLVDMDLTDEEIVELQCCEAQGEIVISEGKCNPNIPMGKQVC